MNRALADFESQRQPSLAELIIEVLRPIFKTVGIKVGHVGHDDLANEIAYDFALLLAVGVQRTNSHAAILSRIDAGSHNPIRRVCIKRRRF